MIRFLRRIWRAAPVAAVILALALAASVFFGAKVISRAIYWNDPAHQEQAIETWMTPGYGTRRTGGNPSLMDSGRPRTVTPQLSASAWSRRI